MSYTARLEQINKGELLSFGTYSNAEKKNDTKLGKKHGAANVPSSDEASHPFKENLVAQAKRELAANYAKLDDFSAELEKDAASREKERDETYLDERARVNEEYEAKKKNLEDTQGAAIKKLRREREDAHQILARLKAELGRDLRVWMPKFYIVFMTFIALGEVPLNRFAFELFFGESPLVSLLLAVLLGTLLALAAHFVGLWLRQATGEPDKKKKRGYYGGAFGILAFLAPLFYLLALMRETYVDFIEKSSMSMGEMLHLNDYNTVVEAVASSELSTSGWTLLLINILVFSLASILSFMRHDPNPDYERAYVKHEKIKKAYDKAENKYNMIVAELSDAHRDKLLYHDRQLERIDAELAEIESAKKLIDNHRSRAASHVALHIKHRLEEYELANRLARKDGTLPNVFGNTSEDEIIKAISIGH